MHFFSKAKLFTTLLTACLLVESMYADSSKFSFWPYLNSKKIEAPSKTNTPPVSSTSGGTPVIFGTLSGLNTPLNIALQETFGAVSDYGNGEMLLFSTTNLPGGTPVIFGTLSGLNSPLGIALQGTFGAVANNGASSGEMLLFSTTNLPSGIPVIFGTLAGLDYLAGLALQGTFGAVMNPSSGEMLLFSTTNLPSGTPVIFGTLAGLDYLTGLALQGTFGAVANIIGEGESEVLLFSTTNLLSGTPTVFGTLAGLNYPSGLALQGTFGAVASFGEGEGEGDGEMLLFSTTNIPGGTPVIFGTLAGLSYPSGVALSSSGTFGAVTSYGEGEGKVLLFSTTNLVGGIPVIFGTLSKVSSLYGLALSTSGTFGAVTNIIGLGEGEVFLFSTTNFVPGPTPTPSILPTTFPGNAGVTAKLLNSINQNCPASTQAIITDLSLLSYQEQYQDLLQLTPQYKVIQFSLEKLDLLLHKELEDALYKAEDKWSGFVLGGYDNLSQKAVSPEKGYNGYTVQSYYQLLGFTYGGKSADFLGAIGASESYMNLNPANGFASYPTAWASIGFSSQSSRWQAGLKGLGGYSFIKAQRSMNYLNLVASTNHNAWNTSVEGKLAYTYQYDIDHAKVTFYDTPSYLYGQENTYTESGATGANFNVKNEKLSVIRNAFGLVFNSQNKKKENANIKKNVKANINKKDQANVEFFVDGSWVFEYYFTNNSYQAAFQGTDVYGNYHQTIPTRNFGRIHGGFKGGHAKFDWALVYTGLFGSHFMENSASLKLEKQF